MNVNALQVRQSFGKILKKMQKFKVPIVIEKGRKPVAVLISMEDFDRRFIDFQEKEKRKEVIKWAGESATKSPLDSLTVLRELRYGSDH